MLSKHQPHQKQTFISHHAQGEYSNGTQLHGLSGGNGMLTLIRSIGNEFSHEIGHHYGLGHYPGRDGDDDFWTTHHHRSEEHTSELQSRGHLVCRLLLEKKQYQ